MTNNKQKSAKLAALIKKTAQKLVKSPKHLQKLALTLPLLALFVEEVRAAQGKGDVFEDLQTLTEFVDAQNLDEAQYSEIEASLDGVQLAANDVTAQDAAAVAEEETEKAALLQEDGTAAGKKKAAALLEPTGEAGTAGRGLAAEAAESDAAGLAGEHAAAATESFELAGLVIPVAPVPLFGAIAAGLGIVANAGGTTNNTETATGSTLSRTLKQLKTDGILFVQPAAGNTVIDVVLGTGTALTDTTGVALFGDTSRDGTVSAAEDSALQVNLIITNVTQLAEVAALSDLAKFGIDSVRIDLSSQDLLNALTSDANSLKGYVDTIRASGLSIDTIDMGVAASLTDTQAHTLLESGLSFAADDTIALQADSGIGTHLGSSLKDLQKLGVDTISTVGDVGHVLVDFDSASGIAAGSAFSTAGIPVFAAGLDVTLNVDSTQMAQVTANAGALSGAAHIDHLNINLMDAQAGTSGAGYANEMAAMLGTSGMSNLSNFSNSTIDLGGSATVGSVGISQAQASSLIDAGLHFAAADTITLQADSGTAGTHLSTSLKELNKLGVDAVTATGSGVVSVDMGGLSLADLGTGGTVTSFADALNVTLNVADATEFGVAADMALKLDTANIDNVKFDVASSVPGDVQFLNEIQTLINPSTNAAFIADVAALHTNHIGTVLDLGGAGVAGQLTVDAAHLNGALLSGISFAANDQIGFEAAMLPGAHSTHLGSTLKDMQKLGVDAVAITGAAAGDAVHIDFGAGAAIDLTTGGLPHFASNLDVTLHVANSSQLNELGTLANTDGVDLGALGIDLVQLNLADQNGFDTLMASEPTLMASLAATPPVTTLSGAVEALRTDHVEINTIDMVSNVVSLTDTQAAFLLDHGLHFAANDVVTVEASGTHLSTSLRELKALGIETTVAMVATDSLSVSLGDGPTIDSNFFNGLPSFDEDFSLTLEVANATQFTQVAQNINSFETLGVDAVQLNLADQQGLTQLLNLDAATATNGTPLDFFVDNVRQAGVELTTIDMGGYKHEGVAHLTADQMGSVIDAGLHFAAADHITVDVASTFHTTNVGNLSQFGVDTVHITDAEIFTTTQSLGALVDKLQEVGVNELGISSSDFEASSAMTSAVKAFDWLASGADFALQVDTGSTAAPQNLGSLINMVQNGVDVLTGVGLADGAKWGDLIETLQDAGLGNVELETSAKVHISDDLSAALYESGMLHALPDAAIAIDVGANKVLNTSLKAMADLGVDTVNTDHKVYVELGLSVDDAQTLAELGDVFSAFGLDSAAPDTHLFGAQGAGLVVDQATFDNFNSMDPAMVEVLLGDLNKLGFTEVDVMGASAVSAVYQINVTAQTPVLSQVALIGTDAINDLAHVFDPDILNKPIK